MKPWMVSIVSATIIASSAMVAAEPLPATSIRLSPAQAVMNAAEMPAGVGGVFEMVVRATGRQDGRLYLNSEADYRDQRNLTIAIRPEEERALAERLGGPVESLLAGKVIAIRGVARKTRIDFVSNGRPSGRYYFQTHLDLRSARDLTVQGERPLP